MHPSRHLDTRFPAESSRDPQESDITANHRPASASPWPLRVTDPGGGLAAVEDLVRRCAPRRVVDIATGLGSVLNWLLGACPSCGHLMGIDVALAALKSARTALTDGRVRLLAMDGAHLAMRDASVDMVTLAYSLHHLPDVAGTLREAVRVLMPGGRLLIMEMHHDDALPSQVLHTDMHGWWADVDTAAGISHRKVYARDQILHFMAPLAMEEITVIEDPGDESQARDEEVLQVYRKRFDTYADKARGQVQYESLVARGQELKARMLQTGCSLPRAVIVTARKPREG